MTGVGTTYRKLIGKPAAERYTLRQTEDWATLNWRKLEAKAGALWARLQRRIYQAKRCGDMRRAQGHPTTCNGCCQQGRCKYCGALFTTDDIIEVHHKNGNRAQGAPDNYRRNLALLHGHCHDQQHAAFATKSGIDDSNHFTEKPRLGGNRRKPAGCPLGAVLEQRGER